MNHADQEARCAICTGYVPPCLTAEIEAVLVRQVESLAGRIVYVDLRLSSVPERKGEME